MRIARAEQDGDVGRRHRAPQTRRFVPNDCARFQQPRDFRRRRLRARVGRIPRRQAEGLVRLNTIDGKPIVFPVAKRIPPAVGLLNVARDVVDE